MENFYATSWHTVKPLNTVNGLGGYRIDGIDFLSEAVFFNNEANQRRPSKKELQTEVYPSGVAWKMPCIHLYIRNSLHGSGSFSLLGELGQRTAINKWQITFNLSHLRKVARHYNEIVLTCYTTARYHSLYIYMNFNYFHYNSLITNTYFSNRWLLFRQFSFREWQLQEMSKWQLCPSQWCSWKKPFWLQSLS